MPVVVHLLYLEPQFDADYVVFCGKVNIWDDGVLLTHDSKLVTCGDCNSRKPGAVKMAAKNR